MYGFLIFYCIIDTFINTTILVIARTYFKNIKVGMLIYFFANICNLLIAYFKINKLVYYNRDVLIITGGFNLASVFYFLSIYMNISSITFNNYYSLKILIVSIFSMYLMSTKYNKWQWLGKALISLGIFIQFENDKTQKFSWAIVTAAFSGLFNAFSTVHFEHRVKNSISSIWNYLFTYNLCYIPFNLCFAVVENSTYNNKTALLTLPFYILVLLNILSSQMSIYLSMQVDSFERSIISMICNISSSCISDIWLDFKIDYLSLYSLFFVSSGTLLYMCFKRYNLQDKNTEIN